MPNPRWADEPAKPADASEDATAQAESEDKPRTTSVVESIDSPAVAERLAAARAADASDGSSDSAEPAPGDAHVPDGPANGDGHAAPSHAEGEAGPEPVNGRDGPEEPPAAPADADAIDTMDAVPAVPPAGHVNGHAVGDDALDIPEFLRRVH